MDTGGMALESKQLLRAPRYVKLKFSKFVSYMM